MVGPTRERSYCIVVRRSLPSTRPLVQDSSMPKLPPFEEQQRYYDEWNTTHRSVDFDDVTDEIRLRAQRVLLDLQSMQLDSPDILEIGCSTGWFCERLEGAGSVHGVDISPKAVDAARERVPSGEFVCGDFCKVGYAPRSFDVVVCLETLFYVEDPARFIAEISRVLRPGGVLFLTTINKYVYDRRSDIGAPKAGQIRNWLSKKELRQLIGNHFNIEKEVTVDPRGDQGLLRVVNSYKINQVLGRVIGEPRLRHAKERMGLGGGVIYEARKP
jgi:2-polyprenyl-3-methyl-5-hydroxy-6-metoxy-1,4-benzoquinol methylase